MWRMQETNLKMNSMQITKIQIIVLSTKPKLECGF